MRVEEVLEKDRRLVNVKLRQVFEELRGVAPHLKAAMRYAVFPGGKRLRPALALEAYRACGGARLGPIMPFCCGIELIHTFSLIHDDLPAMDNDDFRRGKPTLHRRFDEGTAILAADALFALAFEVFASDTGVSVRRQVEAIGCIARAVGPKGMAGGQMFDLEKRVSSERIARLKTAEFIAASIETGAIIAGAQRDLLRRLHRLGMLTGILFQLTDDLLDLEQDTRIGCAVCRQSLQRKTRQLCIRLEKGFAGLGRDFDFFAQLPGFILNRSV